MTLQFVKPYVKTNKNDIADAEAICEAVARPNMRFDPIKNVEQQAILSVHRARQGFVKARNAQANQIRGLLSKFGIDIPCIGPITASAIVATVGNRKNSRMIDNSPHGCGWSHDNVTVAENTIGLDLPRSLYSSSSRKNTSNSFSDNEAKCFTLGRGASAPLISEAGLWRDKPPRPAAFLYP
jgi:hypothetical protein